MKTKTSTGSYATMGVQPFPPPTSSLPKSSKVFSPNEVADFGVISPMPGVFQSSWATANKDAEWLYAYTGEDNDTTELECETMNRSARFYNDPLTGGEYFNYRVRSSLVTKTPF
jgi:hypothetical protein